MIDGACTACGTKAITRLKWKGRWVFGCNRCASRVRQGGVFEAPYKSVRDRRAKLIPKMAKLREQGKTYAQIARRYDVSGAFVRKWLVGV